MKIATSFYHVQLTLLMTSRLPAYQHTSPISVFILFLLLKKFNFSFCFSVWVCVLLVFLNSIQNRKSHVRTFTVGLLWNPISPIKLILYFSCKNYNFFFLVLPFIGKRHKKIYADNYMKISDVATLLKFYILINLYPRYIILLNIYYMYYHAITSLRHPMQWPKYSLHHPTHLCYKLPSVYNGNDRLEQI